VRIEKTTKIVVIEATVRCANPPDVQWFKEKTAVRQDSRRTVNVEQVTKVMTMSLR